MHPRTEDLLTIRDREPIDAALLERLQAEPGVAAELRRLERVRAELGDLPELAPPDGVWERVLAAERSRPGRSRAWLRWTAGGAVAAAAAAAAMLYLQHFAPSSVGSPVPEAATPPAVTPRAGDGPPAVPASFVALVEQSKRLERELAQIPRQRALMSGQTAGTIVGLEDRIAFIDEQLSFGAASDMQMPEQQALWNERVDLMNALVHVRLAQAAPAGF